jgi:predicted RND superfamily exporter protein
MKSFFKYPWIIVIVVLVITAFFIWKLPYLKIDNDMTKFLPHDHPSRVADEKVKDIFGRDDVMVVIMKVHGESIFTVENIKILSEIVSKFQAIKNVKEVNALTNADYMTGEKGTLKTEDIVPELPKNQQDLLAIKKKTFSWDIFKGFLYSKDLTATQITIKLEKNHTKTVSQKDQNGNVIEKKIQVKNAGNEDKQVYEDIQKILTSYKSRYRDFYIAGEPCTRIAIRNNINSDLIRLIPFVIIVVLLFLYLSFQKIGGVFLPLINVIISTIWAIGLMSVFHISFKIMSVVIPIILIAVGNAYCIHLISHYYDEIRAKGHKHLTNAEHLQLLFKILKEVGSPIFLAALTTMVGFATLAASRLTMIRDFGIFTAIGVGIAFVIACTLVPALLMIKHSDKPPKEKKKNDQFLWIEKILIHFYEFMVKRPWPTIVFSAIVLIACIIGITRIHIGTPMINFFDRKTEIRQANDFANKHFNGTSILNIVITGNKTSLPQRTSAQTDNKSLKDDFNFDEDNSQKTNKNMDDDFSFDEKKSKKTDENLNDDFSFNEAPQTKKKETKTTSSKNKKQQVPENRKSVKEPEILLAMDKLKSYLINKYPEVTQVMGFSDFIKRMNKVMHADALAGSNNLSSYQLSLILKRAIRHAKHTNMSGEAFGELLLKELNNFGEKFDEIPYLPQKYGKKTQGELKQLISQYLVLYSGNLDEFINDMDNPTITKLTVQLNSNHPQLITKVKKDILDYTKDHIDKLDYSTDISGPADIQASVDALITSTQLKTILLSLLIVFIILLIKYRSFIAGLLSIIPLAFAILINFALMGFLGIALDMITSLIASITIGIGIDYAIHFIAGYQRERQHSDDLQHVSQQTILKTGKAILLNAVSVALGFSVLAFSSFHAFLYFSLLLATTMITSSFGAMTILPVLLNLLKPKFLTKK